MILVSLTFVRSTLNHLQGLAFMYVNLPVCSSLQLLILNNLNPIVVRIEDKCHVFHATICKPLLPVNTLVIKALACRIKVINGNTYYISAFLPKLHKSLEHTNVSKSLWLIISVVILEVGILLGTIIPS